MAYPGNPELSAQAQERVMTAFRQVVAKLQDGQREEAMIGLEFVLRLDPSFRPALNLQQQLASGAAEIDLSEIISDLQAPTTDNINLLLIEAVEAFEARDFQGARLKVEGILKDLPGHKDSRHLLAQIEDAVKVETQVGQFLGQARDALAAGDPQEAANFVMMAQALDPHHAGISDALATIRAAGGVMAADVTPPAPGSGPAAEAADRRPSFGDPAEHDIRFDTIDESPSTFEASGPGPDFGTGEFEPSAADDLPDFGDASEALGAGGASPLDDGPRWQGEDPSPAPAAEDQLFEATGGDVSDLFEAPIGPEAPAVPPFDGVSTDHDDGDPMAALLRRGDGAFDAQDFAGAIHAWSRILLLDPEHRAASERIAGARVSFEAQRRRVDQLLNAAREASDSGDADAAARFVAEAIELDPTSATAGELRDRTHPASKAAAGPAPPASTAADLPSVPELEDDLFREDDLGDLTVDGGAGPEPRLDLPDELPELPPERRRFRLPVRTIAIGVSALLVLLVGAWFGMRLFSGGGDGAEIDPARVNEVIAQAKALEEENQIEAALELLRSFPAAGLHQERIDAVIARYEARLAPPTPTPIPEAIGVAEQLIGEGRLVEAYGVLMRGLEKHPRDGGLAALRDDILSLEPRIASLHGALVDNRYEAAVGLALELEEQHPDWSDVGAAVNRSLFNASLAQMRSYNLTAAESYLRQLDARAPDDPEVARVLEFVERYKARPVDMQLKIFIRSLKER